MVTEINMQGLTYCGLVMQYNYIDLDQLWLR